MENNDLIGLAHRAGHFHDQSIPGFLAGSAPVPQAHDLWGSVQTNHYFNCCLWQEEDRARRIDVSDAIIVHNKRNIDRFNQMRNDAIERMDEQLLRSLPAPDPLSRQSTETAGAMVDRLSILALKIFHMNLQIRRADASIDHRDTCSRRVVLLSEQRADLQQGLFRLLGGCSRGEEHFKIYRQFKMYNDARYHVAISA